MNIKIIAVGKIKDKNLSALIDDYLYKIMHYAKIEVIEVKEEIKDNLSEKDLMKCIDLEGKSILKSIKDKDYVITLDLKKNEPDSLAFAMLLKRFFVEGGATITFVIGGSYGLSNEVRSRSNYGLSLSKFTFLHTMSRLILLEQIYRAFKINNNEVYHK